MRWWLIAGAPIGGLCVGLMLLVPTVIGRALDEPAPSSAIAATPAPADLGVYVEIPEIVANLSSGSQPRFVKLRLVVRAADEQAATRVSARERELLDVFNGYLHALDPSEYFGAAGFERMRAGLRQRAQLVLGEDTSALRDLLIVEFVRQ